MASMFPPRPPPPPSPPPPPLLAMIDSILPAYAAVHAKYTIPLALSLTALYAPLASPIDGYKLGFHLLIAFVATTPWDSYLIRRGIWSYPNDAIFGPAPLGIPLEEYTFFFVQTWITSLLYFLLSKPVFQPGYLAMPKDTYARIFTYKTIGRLGQFILATTFVVSIATVVKGGTGLYLGLILAWATPVLLLLWSLSYTHLLSLPLKATLLPITLPTLFLWAVDTGALRRGTWVIAEDTKTGIFLWHGLEIEEALFFLLTNVLLVFGQVAFDHALTIITAFPNTFPVLPEMPSPFLLIRALFTPETQLDPARRHGIRTATRLLFSKSRSFSLASSAFSGRLRVDLVLLYAFCRAADDLIDEAPTPSMAAASLSALHQLLDMYYSPPSTPASRLAFVRSTFPPRAHAPLLLLPAYALPRGPLDELLEGFRTDLGFGEKFDAPDPTSDVPPNIESEADLLLYAHRVAGTIGALCVALIRHHAADEGDDPTDDARWAQLCADADAMGTALQLVNIARDVWTDARLAPRGRVYVPRAWLAKENTDARELVRAVQVAAAQALGPGLVEVDACYARSRAERAVGACRARLLRLAGEYYARAEPAVEALPARWGARRGVRCAVESYMAIGRSVWERCEDGVDGGAEARRASVPVWKRIAVAYAALARG